MDENRKFERYDKNLDVKFDFVYAAAADLKYNVDGNDPSLKFDAVSRNIGARGMCLTSHHKLEKGQKLHLELYLPTTSQPIHMDGQVCWCDSLGGNSGPDEFDAGIELNSVEGNPVAETVHFDEQYHVIWSNVLESIFGTFRKQMQSRNIEERQK